MKTLIRGGTVVTATDRYRGDVLIEGETIHSVRTRVEEPVDRIIEASGKLVIPGGIDVHTHLDMPFGGTCSVDDFETGTVAAAHGGTTCLIDFAIQADGGGLRQGWETWMAKAEGKAAIDYGFHMILREYTDELGREMAEMVEEGVTSFKLFTAYPGVFYIDDGAMFRAMQTSGEIGATICIHAENGLVIDELVAQALARGETEPRHHALTRPAAAEAEATRRVIALAEMAGVPVYVVHLTCEAALREVTAARDRGLPVMAETCPQYLFLSHDNYEEPGFEGAKYVMSPPLRPKENQAALWSGLARGDLQAISTDHCPFNYDALPGKRLGLEDFTKIPNGAPGIETRMSLTFDGGVAAGRIGLERWVELVSTAPAKIFGLFPRKGAIAPGSDADIVVFDPEAEQVISAGTHHMNVDYNPYEGRRVKGVSEVVISRGEVIVEGGSFRGSPGRGQYLKRARREESGS